MIVFLSLVLLSILVVLIYIFLTWNVDYWLKHGVKFRRPNIFFGNFSSMVTMRRHVLYDIQDIYEQFRNEEDFVGVFSMRTPLLLVLSPKLVHRIFVTDFKHFGDNEVGSMVDGKKEKLFAENPYLLSGKKWELCRRDIAPAFTPGRIKTVYPVTQHVCRRMVDYIRKIVPIAGSDGIDMNDLSLRFMCEVVSDCVLGLKADCFGENPTPIFAYTKTLLHFSTTFMIYQVAVGLLPIIKKFYKAKLLTEHTDIFFFDLLKSAMALRRQKILDRMDFMSYILQLQEKRGLTDEQLTSNTMTFFVDGCATSASVIENCLLQLARKASVQELLYKEIMSNLNTNEQIDFEKLDQLPYLDQCINETIRLIPPHLWLYKIVTEPIELTNRNNVKLRLNVKDVVILPLHSIHHDKQFYPNPEEFTPERFSPENGGADKFREQGMFYAFGDGPRVCLGMRFALTQIKAAVVDVVRNFKLKVNPKTRTDNELNSSSMIGQLKGGVYIDIESRTE